MSGACDDCLRRTALMAALAGWLDIEWRRRDAPARVLALRDEAAALMGRTEPAKDRTEEENATNAASGRGAPRPKS